VQSNICRGLGAIFASLCVTLIATGQIPVIDSNAGKPVNVVTDDNFEPQKRETDGRNRRALTYEVWITTDGILHCKTNHKLASARIEFTSPKAETLTALGAATLAKRGRPRILNVAMDSGPNGYLFDIRKDGYKEKQSITLHLTSVWNSGAVINIVNKNVQPQMSPQNQPTESNCVSKGIGLVKRKCHP